MVRLLRLTAGDLGNFRADEQGSIFVSFSDPLAGLYGDHAIYGKSFVVHAKEDDLGRGDSAESKKTGNAGGRLACGTIPAARLWENDAVLFVGAVLVALLVLLSALRLARYRGYQKVE